LDAAIIAVIGTLGGVLITAAAGIITATLTARNQRALVATQAEQERRKTELIDRRADFGRFLQAYDDVFAGGEDLFARAKRGATGLDPRKELFKQIRAFKQAHLILSITAPSAVWNASDRCLGSIWHLLDAAVTGDEAQFEHAVQETRQPRNQVRVAMRAEFWHHRASGACSRTVSRTMAVGVCRRGRHALLTSKDACCWLWSSSSRFRAAVPPLCPKCARRPRDEAATGSVDRSATAG
jgi:hypothetical protein